MNIPSAGGPDIDTDGTLAANSDTLVASQKAVKTYADALIAANDAMVFKGVIDCSSNPNYPAADRGHQYRASVAGKIGGASGINVEVGDMILCLTDGTISGNQATVGTNWAIIQTNLDGALLITDIGVTVQGYDADLQSYGAAADAAARRDLIGATSGVWQASAGGTGNAFFAVTGPTTSTKTYTLRNASTNIVTAPSALVTDRVPYINSNGELISNSSLTYSAGLFSVDGSPGYRCTYGGLWMGILDVGATGNAGRFIIGTAAGSTSDIILRGSTQENVFNETGKDQDERHESDTDPNCLTLDGGNDSIAVGVAPGSHPAGSKFTVATTTKASIPAPKMDTTARDLLGNLVAGLLIYNTTTAQLEDYDGATWAAV